MYLFKKRRRIDKIVRNDNIISKDKYTILYQNYNEICFTFHFIFKDKLFEYKSSLKYINDDIDTIIKDFINPYIYLDISLKIIYDNNHPFSSPSFKIMNVKNNLNNTLNNKLKIYFTYIIEEIFKKLKRSWSPIIPMNVLLMYIYNLIIIEDFF